MKETTDSETLIALCSVRPKHSRHTVLLLYRPKIFASQMDESYVLSSVELARCDCWAAKLLERMRLTEDLHVQLKDGTVVGCNRAVMCVASPHLCAMTSFGWHHGADHIVLGGVSGGAFSRLVDFCHGGILQIDEGTVMELLECCDLLGVSEATEICCVWIKARLEPHTVLEVIQFAGAHMLVELKEAAVAYSAIHFLELDNADVMRLEHGDLVDLLQSDKMIVGSELQVLQAAMRWVKHDQCVRESALPYLLANVVRWHLLCTDDMNRCLESEPILKSDFTLRRILSDMLLQKVLGLLRRVK